MIMLVSVDNMVNNNAVLLYKNIYFMLHDQTLAATNMDDQELTESIQRLLIVMQRLDQKIAPLLETDGEHFNRRLVKVREPFSCVCLFCI